MNMGHVQLMFRKITGYLFRGWAIIRDRYFGEKSFSCGHKAVFSAAGSRKVVIWGHKPHTHTHSYIHGSYFRAFKKMGYDTYWLDDRDDVSGFDFKNCIFLTEGQADAKIPLEPAAVYVLHNCRLEKYKNSGLKYVNLCNYVNDCRIGKSFNFPGGAVEKLTYYSYYDAPNRALYQPWGTDLMPEEIQEKLLMLDARKGKVCYIGSIWDENLSYVERFAKACKDNRKKFVNVKYVSRKKAVRLIRDSYLFPDIRGPFHVSVGYIPCRVFKNISYGCIPATNSAFVRDFFGGAALPYAEDPYGLFKANEEFLSGASGEESARWLVDEVKKHHTYVTRVDTILSVISGGL